jgi:hypothetical protein
MVPNLSVHSLNYQHQFLQLPPVPWLHHPLFLLFLLLPAASSRDRRMFLLMRLELNVPLLLVQNTRLPLSLLSK